MPRQVTAAWKRISDTIGAFTFAQKTLAILALLVLVLGTVGLGAWLTRPNYVPLFSGISATDASAITNQLHTDGVSYQLTDGGATVLVPKAAVYTERIKAAAAGLPSSSNKGYSLLDKMGVTTSEFDENVTYKRAMEGELANTIDAMDGVSAASVKLAIPQPTVFTDQQQDPTASVFVQLTPGTTLDTDQVQAIIHLVSASIVDMKPSDVSVVDANGNVLSTVGGGPAGGATAQAADYDTSVQNGVQRMLDKVLGPGNSTVVVNAVLDGSTSNKTTKTHSVPAGSPAASSTEQKEEYSGSGAPAAASGLLGTTTQTTGATQGGTYSSQSTTKDNALNTVTETQQIPAGRITRQSVSVAVDQAAAAANGVSAQQVNDLVSAAAGVDAARGDAVSVQLVNFSKVGAAAAKQALAQAARQAAARQRQRLIRDGIIALGIVIAGLAAGILVRRARRRPSDELVPAGIDGVIPGLPTRPDVPEFTAVPTAAPPTPPADAGPGVLDARRRRAEIAALAENDPKKAAEYLRGLMEERNTV